MLRATTIGVIAASLVVLFMNEASARGRSFPVEVTGTVLSFDQMTHTFTIRADEPARILTIAIGRDCKCKQNGVSAGEQIVRSGARLKVSYFATVFSGNIAVEIELDPRPEVKTGIVERIDPLDRRLNLRTRGESSHVVLRWASNARFIQNGRKVSATALRQGAVVTISYFSPAFASRYAVKLEFH
jgi:hypothetical protein